MTPRPETRCPNPSLTPSDHRVLPPIEVWVTPPPKQRYWFHALLLVATIFTTLVVGARMEFNFLQGLSPFIRRMTALSDFSRSTWCGASGALVSRHPFFPTLMLILLAHEMGHYLYCLRYG